MKTNTLTSILLVGLFALLVYVTVTPIAMYKAAHEETIKQITYELVEPGSELETFILANDTIDYEVR